MVAGERVFVGRPDKDVSPEVGDVLQRLQTEGKTAVVVNAAGRVIGVLAVADEIRPDAAEAIGSLRGLGLRHIVMLTGDNESTAAAIARTLGIDDWRANLLPHEKTAALQQLREQYGPILMVGDGINDAPALATADVGIAMGAAGTDVALETADVALMADDLSKLPEAIRLSRRAMTNIRQNIAMSLTTVAVLVLGALAGWLSLTTGLLLNEGSALLIIANGLRLLAAGARDGDHTPAEHMRTGAPAAAAATR
jgi:Cd2+/Zn2+-exporting ATPase